MSDVADFQKVLEPGYIGKVRLRNRMIKTASGSSLIEKDGTIGDRIIAWYEAMAKGGIGLIIFETTSIEHPRGSHRPKAAARLSDDSYLPGFSNLTEAVHKHGCPIFIQLMHSGAWYAPNQDPPGDRISASTIPPEELPGEAFAPPRGLSLNEVEEMIDKFATAAVRAQQAGFDGVEINGSHYHLINSFLSGWWNRRHDEYGCDSHENRARFMCSIIREVKNRCGSDFPVDILINAVEFGLPYGATTLEDSKIFAKFFEEAGADSIQLRTDGFGEFNGSLHLDRFFYPELPEHLKVKELDWTRRGKGVAVPLATEIKKAVSIPAYVASRLDPVIGEEYLREGKLDFIGMTRRLIADPELPNKVAAGRYEDVAPCAGCLWCWHNRLQNLPLKCRVNAAMGREREYEIKPAEKKKKVLVVGGGPAGLEAARVAALEGHDVTLVEQGRRLGGLMPMAALVKDLEMDSILDQVRYFTRQIRQAGVTIRLKEPVDRESVQAEKPDVIILANGGTYDVPDIPGIDSAKVIRADKLHRQLKSAMNFFSIPVLARLTRAWMPVGKRVVIIGGETQGCQLGEFLVKRGRQVTIVDTAKELGEGLLTDDPWRLFRWFKEKGVALYPGVRYEEINSEGLVITTNGGERKTLVADSIITALPFKPDTSLLRSLEGAAASVYQIGDCRQPGYMYDAVDDGSRVAREIQSL